MSWSMQLATGMCALHKHAENPEHDAELLLLWEEIYADAPEQMRPPILRLLWVIRRVHTYPPGVARSPVLTSAASGVERAFMDYAEPARDPSHV